MSNDPQATGVHSAYPPARSTGGLGAKIASYGRHGLRWAIFLIGLILVPALYHTGEVGIETINLLGRYLALAIVAVSLDLVWGYTGMLSLCQAFFFCLGGYCMGMYLAHHGGPEGIIDATGWKLPACLYVVYPYKVGEAPADALVPWFWKPFWTLPLTLILGLLIPAAVAGLIGFFVFRSRVRGVFFAVLTQAITLAAWLVFSMNNMKMGGTNGLTRFDRVILGSREQVEVRLDPLRLRESGPNIESVQAALRNQVATISGAELSGTELSRVITVPHGYHAWNTKQQIESLSVNKESAAAVRLRDVADVRLAGLLLTDSDVKLGLYVLTVLALAGTYVLCRMIVRSRLGRVLVAIRDNESRLRFSGYQPYHFKMLVFALSAALAGLAGMLYVPQHRIITPHNMRVSESILVVIWVAVGGRGTLSGPILGALVVNLTRYYFTSQREFTWFLKGLASSEIYNRWVRLTWQPNYWPFVLGALFVGVVLLLPDGLISLPGKLLGIWQRLTRKRSESVDSDAGPERRTTEPGRDEDTNGVGLKQHLQRVALLQRERTISIQQRSLLDTELLRVENIQVLFDGFKALDIDEFSVDHYELQVIIGPNGAGKTTLCDVISGKTRPTTGKVFFVHQDITSLPEVGIARLGVGRKFQTPIVFDSLTVYESMELALPGRQNLLRNFRRGASSEEQDRIHSIMRRVRLDAEANRRVKYLSHGQRQWLEISMLLLARPRLLLVDEPAAGLTDEETALTAELLLELQNEHSVIVIEHDMDFVRLLNSRVTVLNEGKIMAQGSMEQIQSDPKVVEAYLGRGGSRRASA